MGIKKELRKELEFKRQELLVLLQNHSNLRTGQDQVLWSIFGAFWATQGLLLVSIFTANNYQGKVGWVISSIGIVISFVWLFIQNRALLRIKKYENAIRLIEQQLELPESLCGFLSKEKKSGLKARDVMRLSAFFSLLLWIVALILFIITHNCP